MSGKDNTTASQPTAAATANEWWVVWQQGSPAVLYGQQVLTNGSKAGLNNALFTTSHNHTTPALATNSLTNTLMPPCRNCFLCLQSDYGQ
ncbi:MAG: hypothetical protein KJ063_22745 [Anaerolineae bacterium]|nr:hypothetical protein [Anaerolineae bacterium]